MASEMLHEHLILVLSELESFSDRRHAASVCRSWHDAHVALVVHEPALYWAHLALTPGMRHHLNALQTALAPRKTVSFAVDAIHCRGCMTLETYPCQTVYEKVSLALCSADAVELGSLHDDAWEAIHRLCGLNEGHSEHKELKDFDKGHCVVPGIVDADRTNATYYAEHAWSWSQADRTAPTSATEWLRRVAEAEQSRAVLVANVNAARALHAVRQIWAEHASVETSVERLRQLTREREELGKVRKRVEAMQAFVNAPY